MAIAIWTAAEIAVHRSSCDEEPAAGTFLLDDHRRDDEDSTVAVGFGNTIVAIRPSCRDGVPTPLVETALVFFRPSRRRPHAPRGLDVEIEVQLDGLVADAPELGAGGGSDEGVAVGDKGAAFGDLGSDGPWLDAAGD